MKYAIVNGKKTEAFKGGQGFCPFCNSELLARCGDIKINHWAHKGMRNCDIWWENETEWHRYWKNQFPKEWQEIVHFDNKGEKHIADVKTKRGWILEFQHSFIKPEERISRIIFYAKIIWVIDGTRRKTDSVQFSNALNQSRKVPFGKLYINEISFPDETRLLKEWYSYGVPIFFDFLGNENSPLWFFLPLSRKNNKAYVIPFSREEFIRILNDDGFDELCNKILPELDNMLLNPQKTTSMNKKYYSNRNRQQRRRKF